MWHAITRILAAVLFGAWLTTAAAAPNIVYILADDLDAVAATEMSQVRTLIAQPGASFRRHYVTLSLCCPSRLSALRGQFSHNTGIYTNGPPDGGFEAIFDAGLEASTAATWLKKAGYRTALMGKYFNGYPNTAGEAYIPPGWNEWFSPVSGTPYKAYDYVVNDNGTQVSYGQAPKDYLTDVLSAKATSFIRRAVAKQPGQPFFLYLAPYAPHAPATPAPRHDGTLAGLTAPRPPSFNEEDVSDKPAWVQSQPPLTAKQLADIDTLYQHRREALLAVDEMVQAVVDTLQQVGVLDNTYVIFTSDNGYHQGQHRLDSGKNTAYEEDLLVPLYVRGPGISAGRSVDLFTANVDMAPTFAEMAGQTTPNWVDGRSLLPLLLGRSPGKWRQALLLEHKAEPARRWVDANGPLEPSDPFDAMGGGHPGIDSFEGLRLADGTTYLEYVTGEFELYDNLTDPFQLNNLYPLTDAATRARLAGWLQALRGTAGFRLRLAERAPP